MTGGAAGWALALVAAFDGGQFRGMAGMAEALREPPAPSVPTCDTCGARRWAECVTIAAKGRRELAALVHFPCVLKMAGHTGPTPPDLAVVALVGGIRPEAACAACERAVLNLANYTLHAARCFAGHPAHGAA